MVIQGRELGDRELGQIQSLMAEHPGWGRTTLNKELCQLWDWRNAQGRIKDIRADWMEKYAHPVHALETFVDQDRFEGTCYRAANWWRVGQTKGRTSNEKKHRVEASIKAIYLYPLVADFKEELCS